MAEGVNEQKETKNIFFLWFSAKDLMEIKVSGVNFFATLHWLNEGLQERTRNLALGEDKVDKCQLCSLICFFSPGQLAHCEIQAQVFCWHQIFNYHSSSICTTTALTS